MKYPTLFIEFLAKLYEIPFPFFAFTCTINASLGQGFGAFADPQQPSGFGSWHLKQSVRLRKFHKACGYDCSGAPREKHRVGDTSEARFLSNLITFPSNLLTFPSNLISFPSNLVPFPCKLRTFPSNLKKRIRQPDELVQKVSRWNRSPLTH